MRTLVVKAESARRETDHRPHGSLAFAAADKGVPNSPNEPVS